MKLGISAYFAIKRAIMAAREDLIGDRSWQRIDVPATTEKI